MNVVIFKQLGGKDVDAIEDKLRAMISKDFYLPEREWTVL